MMQESSRGTETNGAGASVREYKRSDDGASDLILISDQQKQRERQSDPYTDKVHMVDNLEVAKRSERDAAAEKRSGQPPSGKEAK